MKNKIIYSIVLLCGLIASTASAQVVETTGYKQIGQLQMAGSGVTLQPTSGTWGSSYCSARFAFLSTEHGQYKELLALLLTMKVSGDRIAVRGTCNTTNGSFFDISRVVVQ